MKSLKNLGKLFGILLGALSFGSVFTSCAKERTCVCSYQDDGTTYDVFELTIKGDCEDADAEINFFGDSTTLTCVEK